VEGVLFSFALLSIAAISQPFSQAPAAAAAQDSEFYTTIDRSDVQPSYYSYCACESSH
jgi:hypothetical protein